MRDRKDTVTGRDLGMFFERAIRYDIHRTKNAQKLKDLKSALATAKNAVILRVGDVHNQRLAVN